MEVSAIKWEGDFATFTLKMATPVPEETFQQHDVDKPGKPKLY
jgi:hypothetical protein